MNIGAGIALVVIGLILLLGVVQVDIPWVDDYTLGVLLALAGVIALVLSMSLGRRVRDGSDSRVVERRVERNVDNPDYL
jgi:drug/metabolite transporter (DMT)-like permease